MPIVEAPNWLVEWLLSRKDSEADYDTEGGGTAQ